jgi:hypothetical protein
MKVGSLVEDQEQNFLAAYLFDGNLGLATALGQGDELLPPTWKNTMRDLIAHSQNFVRNLKLPRVAVSIRDLVRALQLYKVWLHLQYCNFYYSVINFLMYSCMVVFP